MRKLRKAIEFATEKHRGQKYYSDGSPYIQHCLAVMKLVGRIRNDEDVLCAAVLHDVIEDCGVKPKELEKIFGKRVMFLVKELSSNHTPYGKIRSKDALIIKMADSLHNTMKIPENDGKRLEKRRNKIRKTFFNKG
ncbi:MAG: bifunctional (p)ppGpp synthetase/guanosine-3',5'-bis(diphosphate) 3'-pyrophosphohydrolase [Candidatus Aenigmarchaeota archaeon]|nr:bifunctional (p)ppGpp synthetase/guanosine-3',5'-bis(diphosphate) 3'-pyrophosphohydrolase [Candidatus Aenigmarchaeota archaeon]